MTALASYLAARSAQGRWLLRIDDLDTQRVHPDAESQILGQLEAHGLAWDEPPRRQSEHLDEYRQALQQLIESGQTFACQCTRAELGLRSLPGPDGPIYDGHCRDLNLRPEHHALRLRSPDQELQFHDMGQGLQRRRLDLDIGDFVLRRRDGVYAYQLACAVDESAQGITEVLRGADLLSSTFMQIQLMHQLQLRTPQYRHIAVLIDSSQRKLSKQNHALAVQNSAASANLVRCLELLGQTPAPALQRASCGEILNWATSHWTPAQLPRATAVELRSL